MSLGNNFPGKIFATFLLISRPSTTDMVGGNMRGLGEKLRGRGGSATVGAGGSSSGWRAVLQWVGRNGLFSEALSGIPEALLAVRWSGCWGFLWRLRRAS